MTHENKTVTTVAIEVVTEIPSRIALVVPADVLVCQDLEEATPFG
jgi:hypothetical protein